MMHGAVGTRCLRAGYSLAVFMVIVLVAGCGSSVEDAQLPWSQPILVRKSVVDLSSQERIAFVRAVKRMKQIPSSYKDGINAYDYFVELHTDAFGAHSDEHGGMVMPNAHMNPCFLPWHREFLHRFELELRRASDDPMMTLPYWDWSNPSSFSKVFSDELLGGDGDPQDNYRVKTGPFRDGQWSVLFLDDTDDELDGDIDLVLKPGALQRKFGDGAMPTAQEATEAVLTYRPYDVAPFNRDSDIAQSFRNYLEGWWPNRSALHNGVHVYIGGQMQTGSSPNDPAFFLHHANIDRLWALYQETWGSNFPSDYADEELYGFDGVTAKDTFDLKLHSGDLYR